jgi:hypothetical protein
MVKISKKDITHDYGFHIGDIVLEVFKKLFNEEGDKK